jgi:hypothetical protein
MVLSPLPVTQMVLACGWAATPSGSLPACIVAATVSVRPLITHVWLAPSAR